MSPRSRTDWERLDSLTDDQIDTSDIPPLDDRFFERAQWRSPTAEDEEMLPEYDFSGGIRGKYGARYAAESSEEGSASSDSA
jgi:hypothetical protein